MGCRTLLAGVWAGILVQEGGCCFSRLFVHGGTMPALTSRQEARERVRKLFEQSLDRMIPADENVPLRGQTFRDGQVQICL